ncbi:NLR family CARD domain-containing protein 3 [Cyprinus carpio]|uniref:NLR family CARD domain-containing protein 3 n=1 Tax=Cyprinus carpio TaxID=7962 RepID=A0A9Q9YWK5_CYPCA|nr:NLR family CARD domain-containing protein 3 [Cyprinus carpio]
MNAEKDADYDNTCNGEKRVQQERPHSPVLSVLSMKSDKLMKMPIQLKAEDSLFNQSPEEKSDSPVPSVLSMKSDKSMKMPIQLKDGECLFDQSALERSHSPDPSVWSLKSDKSMKMPIQLKDGDSVSDQSFEERSHSPDPSVLSLKSDKSMKMPIQLKDGDSVSDQSSEERSHSPDSSVLSLKSDKSMKMPIQLKDGQSVSHQSSLLKSHSPDYSSTQITIHMRDEKNLPHQRHELQIHDREIQQRLKSYIKRKHQYIFEGLEKQGNPTLLNQIYTELYIIEEEAGGISNKHEFTRIEKTFTAAGATIPIKCSDIFRALPGQDKPIRTVLTKGVAGIGKTVSVQKFILDWAEGKENQDVQLLFPLPFREINLIKDKKFSLVSLLQTFLMRETNLHLIQNSSVVFIFDGLDECRLPLNFQSNETLQDVTKETSVDVLLTNLIVGNLLPSALIWITSRPAAADLVPSECVHRVTEVRGFNDPQKEEYFRKISDQSLADRIISHLKSSRSLFIMCHIPVCVFCWISAAVLEKMLSRAESGEIPKTLTQMYTHFLMAQINIKDTKYNEKKSKDKEMILKLGKLAYEQLDRGNLIFYEEDLRECGIDVTEASVYSGLCSQIFREEFGLYQGKVFCFVHLSVQEHLAALYVHLSFHNSRINVLEAHESGSPVTMLSLHKCAVKKAFGSRNGHLDLFLRFLMGLSLESNHSLLEGLLVTKTDSSLEREKTIEYLKQELKEQLCPNDCVLLFHCLNELNDHSLTDESQSCEKQNMSPALWRALVYKLMTSDQRSEEFELQKYGRSDDILEWLHTVIKLFTKARLNDCNLTYKGCALLTTVLTSLSNVRELDLSNNNLQDSGVEILCVGVNRSPSGAEFLRKREMERKMHSHSQHKHGNEESQLHFHHRTAGLQDKDCSLKSLKIKDIERKMHNKGLASTCGSHNQHKHGNEEIHFHLHHRTAGLQDTECSLKSLKLEKCGMTERSCTALASALSSKTCSLTDLDLSINDLQDSGVKKLCAGLQNPHCTLEKLRLSNCNVTHEGVTALTEALKSNPSHLKELDLAKNDLEESDLKVLSIILDTS